MIATVLEATPATEPGICAFLEMEDPVPVEPEAEAVVESEPEAVVEPELELEAASESEDSSEPEPEPEPVQTPGPAPEPTPGPSTKEEEKLRIVREVKAARDKMEELDKARNALLTQLLVLRHKHEKLSSQRGWRTIVDMEEIARQVKDLSEQVDQLDKQLSDARLAYAETRAASLQALKELGQ